MQQAFPCKKKKMKDSISLNYKGEEHAGEFTKYYSGKELQKWPSSILYKRWTRNSEK